MNPPKKMNDDAITNPYLALRAAKISRNQARLRELGLLKAQEEYQTVYARKRQRKVEPEKKVVTDTVILRRSRRLKDQPEKPDYKEESLQRIEVVRKIPRPSRSATSETSERSVKLVPKPPPPPANSVRSIRLDTKCLVLDDKDGVLGLLMERTGKEFVINEAFRCAAVKEDKQRLEGYRLSFNKYCGVQEWENAIFLWVNLGDKGTVVNDFLNNATQITWFGGSRMHDDSPVIHKLIRLGKKANTDASNIVLWCRKYEIENKKFSPYMCLGRLKYESHVPGSHPLSFVWTLLDYDALRNHSENQVRHRFQSFTNT